MPTTRGHKLNHASLDARNFDKVLGNAGLEGVDRTAHPWGGARAARQELQKTVGNLHEARAAIMRDSTRTEAERHRLMGDAVDKAYHHVSRRLSGAEESLRRHARQADANIEAVFNERMPSEASEIRTYVRGLNGRAERLDFLHTAIKNGDIETAAAVLSARPYLSGLDDKMAGTVRKEAERVAAPSDVKARDAALEGADEIVNAMRLFDVETGDMADMREAQRAKEEREKSEAAIRQATSPTHVDPEETEATG